jgi:hypothetical protein
VSDNIFNPDENLKGTYAVPFFVFIIFTPATGC